MSRKLFPTRKGLASLWAIALTFVLLSACGPYMDREALATLYRATGGPNWINNENWLTDAPLQDWYGVTTDEDGRVIKLVLSANGLMGAIPSELASLDRLRVLDLTAERTVTTTTVRGTVGITIGGDSPSLSSQLEQAGKQLDVSTETDVQRNRLIGCIPSNLRGQLDLNVSDLGGLPFCDEMSVPTTELIHDLADADPNELYPATASGLYGAVSDGDVETARDLVDAGVNVNAKTTAGESILASAVIRSTPEVVQILVEAGADVNARDSFGKPVLFEAISPYDWGPDPQAKLHILVDAGADVNVRDDEGRPVLSEAIRGGNPEIVRILVDAGADVNAKDDGGGSILSRAKFWGNPEIVQILVEAGAVE